MLSSYLVYGFLGRHCRHIQMLADDVHLLHFETFRVHTIIMMANAKFMMFHERSNTHSKRSMNAAEEKRAIRKRAKATKNLTKKKTNLRREERKENDFFDIRPAFVRSFDGNSGKTFKLKGEPATNNHLPFSTFVYTRITTCFHNNGHNGQANMCRLALPIQPVLEVDIRTMVAGIIHCVGTS